MANKIESYKRTISRQREEIASLRSERERAEKGTKQLSKLVDAILAQVAVEHGKATETGYEIEMTSPKFENNEYRVKTEVKDGKYLITVTKKSQK